MLLDAHPYLLLVQAAVLVLLHQLDRAERDLDAAEFAVQRAEPALRQRIIGEAAAIRAEIASLQDNMPFAITLAQQALAELPTEDVGRRGGGDILSRPRSCMARSGNGGDRGLH